MYITSTINPLTKSSSDIPIVLLCYEETRKFILRPQNYADLVQITQENFDLGPNGVPVFETSTLDICRGKNVEITEGVYALINSFLDEITVVRRERGGDRESPQFEGEKTPPLLHTPSDTPSAGRKIIRGKGKGPYKHEIAFNTPKSAATPGNRKGPSPGSWREMSDEREERARMEAAAIQKSVSWTEGVTPKATRGMNNHVRQRAEIQPQEEDDDERYQPGMSDTWSNIEESEEIPDERRRASPRNPTDRARQSPSNASRTLSESAQSVDSSKDHDRFNVTIYGPRTDQEAAFKTRGQHTVKRVLAGACKTFGVNFEGARLAILISSMEDGVPAQHMAKCDNEATIEESGIDEYTQLMIVLPQNDRHGSESDNE